MTLAATMAEDLGVPVQLTNATREEMAAAIDRGFGDQDTRAFLKLQLERAGVDVAADRERVQQAVKEAQHGATGS